MPKKKTQLDHFTNLTWRDLEEWAGNRIVTRGKNYQRQGRICDLAVTADGSLIAWVDGTKRYATKVVMDDGGLPDSTCSCPYEFDCKHAVAVVIEYLKRIEDDQPILKASHGDSRLKLVEDEDWDDVPVDEEKAVSEDVRKEINLFLKGKTKAQLIALINEITRQHAEVAQELVDRLLVERMKLYPCVRLRSKRPATMNAWSIYWFRRGATRKPNTGLWRECAP